MARSSVRDRNVLLTTAILLEEVHQPLLVALVDGCGKLAAVEVQVIAAVEEPASTIT